MRVKNVGLFVMVFVLMFSGLAIAGENTTWTTVGDALPLILATLLTAFSPFIIQTVKKAFKEKWVRYLCAIGISALTGFVAALISKVNLGLENIAIWSGIVIAYSQVAYNTWKSMHIEPADEPELIAGSSTVTRRGN